MFEIYGRICYLCGHPGANEAGHIKALAEDPNQVTSAQLIRPMHGSSSPCARCGGRACNQEQGTKSLESMFKPKLVW
jgi:hypothetical protein